MTDLRIFCGTGTFAPLDDVPAESLPDESADVVSTVCPAACGCEDAGACDPCTCNLHRAIEEGTRRDAPTPRPYDPAPVQTAAVAARSQAITARPDDSDPYRAWLDECRALGGYERVPFWRLIAVASGRTVGRRA